MYVSLAPVITALRERPEEFEDIGGRLHHIPSRHMFAFESDGSARIVADCDCARLLARPKDSEMLQASYRQWHATYWQAVAINRQFASHFAPRSRWRQFAVRIVSALLHRLNRTEPERHLAHRTAF